MIDTAQLASLADVVDWGVAQDPPRPYLTYYDDTTHERTELSFKTFGNWVAKTSHLLREAGAAAPGTRVAVWLPSHWQTVVVLAATWAVGSSVVVIDTLDELLATPADVVVVAEDRLSSLLPRRGDAAGLGTVVAISLRPMGGGLISPRPGVVDYADEVAAQPDDLVRGGALDDLAVQVGEHAVSGRELLDLAAEVVAAQGLGPTDRCMSMVGESLADDGLVVGSLACLLAGAGLVLCLGLQGDDLAARVATEQVTLLAAPAELLARAAADGATPPRTRLRSVLARGTGAAPPMLLGAPVTRA